MAQICVELVSTAPLPALTEADDGLATLTCSASGPSGSWSATVSTSSSLAGEVLDQLAGWARLAEREAGDRPSGHEAGTGQQAAGARTPAGRSRLLDAAGPVEGGFFLQLVQGDDGLSVLAAQSPATPGLHMVTAVPVTVEDLHALAQAARTPGAPGADGYRFIRLGEPDAGRANGERLTSAPVLTIDPHGVDVTGCVAQLPATVPSGFPAEVARMLRQWQNEPSDWDGQRRTARADGEAPALELQARGVVGDVVPGGRALRLTLLARTAADARRLVPLWYWWARPEDLERTLAGWDGGDRLTLWGAAA